MKILIEGQKYDLKKLTDLFEDQFFFQQIDQYAIVTTVGYYYSYKSGELIYMLPKVFMTDNENTVFGISKNKLFNLNSNESFKHKSEYAWIRQILVYFYSSLGEFRKRNKQSKITQELFRSVLNTSLGDKEYSYLDLVLSFISFYKKNKTIFLLKYIECSSRRAKKINWEKTIRKSTPFLTKKKQPVYNIYRHKSAVVNSEEELMVYFFSILNFFNKEHRLCIDLGKIYTPLEGLKFKQLQKNGLSKLRKIKYRYFNDDLLRIYQLCEMYFSKIDTSSIRGKEKEFICISNYNVVFEDMVDKLLSNPVSDDNVKKKCGAIPKHLKYNGDGKIIDHIFNHQSLLDTSDIFYVGDSKYYKSDGIAGKVSKYKQFTYAKNIIQYNIDVFNKTGNYYTDEIRYRDEITEGYNITPNFFIYGFISNYKNFETSQLEEKDQVLKSFHFIDRLFDRDTLFVHQYKINYLFVLKTYVQLGSLAILKFREDAKREFRNNCIEFLSSEKFEFEFYEYEKHDFEDFVEKNFKKVNGKVFITNNKKMLLAKHVTDSGLDDVLIDFKKYKLS